MELEPLGESAFMLRDFGVLDPFRLSDLLCQARIPGVQEAVGAYETVAVYVDPDVFDPRALLDWVERGVLSTQAFVARAHKIPVCYEMGEDLAAVAACTELSVEQVVQLHCSTTYLCYAVGFSPGFPYLGYLPPELQGVPRRESPRLRVPAGSVAIAGRQTGVYPEEKPGGWALLGRTPLKLVDLKENYFPIRAGDTVSFERIDENRFSAMAGGRL